MTIPPIGPTPASIPTTPTTTPTSGASGTGFVDGLAEALKSTGEVNQLAQDLATGELTDVHQFTAAAEKASLAMELTVAVRDRALAAYQQVMQMQL